MAATQAGIYSALIYYLEKHDGQLLKYGQSILGKVDVKDSRNVNGGHPVIVGHYDPSLNNHEVFGHLQASNQFYLVFTFLFENISKRISNIDAQLQSINSMKDWLAKATKVFVNRQVDLQGYLFDGKFTFKQRIDESGVEKYYWSVPRQSEIEIAKWMADKDQWSASSGGDRLPSEIFTNDIIDIIAKIIPPAHPVYDKDKIKGNPQPTTNQQSPVSIIDSMDQFLEKAKGDVRFLYSTNLRVKYKTQTSIPMKDGADVRWSLMHLGGGIFEVLDPVPFPDDIIFDVPYANEEALFTSTIKTEYILRFVGQREPNSKRLALKLQVIVDKKDGKMHDPRRHDNQIPIDWKRIFKSYSGMREE